MLDSDLTLITFESATEHGLPVWLVRALVRVESGGNPWAYRYEPSFLARYVPAKPQLYGAISIESERMGLATSWGLMQIMGLVARERGFDRPYLSELCQPRQGIEYGCNQLAHLRDRFLAQWDWPGVVSAYNAGSPRITSDGQFANQDYVDKVFAEKRE